ncbi:hypothetical protein [Micrococcus sp. IITD107]|uniref:hypothetical protein n=1 Tax=Micrococcus sp. IITD107 TaxID=3342790 RepID=UPI0035BB418B
MTDRPPLTGAEPHRPEASKNQHAVRVLVLLDTCGDPVTDADPDEFVKVIRSELRLQALDFWLRNPDYLADQVISKVEAGELDAARYLPLAQHLLDGPEPNLHWYPMPKWLRGAYEALDDAFSMLQSYGLAEVRRKGNPPRRYRNEFYLKPAGVAAAVELAADPVLSWYGRQAELVHLVAGSDKGGRLKERQYEQAEYAQTQLGLRIASIAPVVRERLAIQRQVSGASK